MVERDPSVDDQVWEQIQTAKHSLTTNLLKIKSDLESSNTNFTAKKDKLKEVKKIVQIQKKLKKIGKCPMGFVWTQVPNGWRCAGGSHYVSDTELKQKFCE
jgi:hypothetical protein